MTRLSWIFALFAILSGCAVGSQETNAPLVAQSDYESEDDASWFSPQNPAVADMFRKIADMALGTPYKWGGTSLGGFDCSGFVQWAYKAMGIDLPRTAREQSQIGRTVSYGDLRVGDIVAFRHPRRGWHSGIYMGDDQFVHSPSRRGERVRYSSMGNPYFRVNFVTARRVIKSDTGLDFEETVHRLALAESEKRFIPNKPKSKVSRKGKGKSQAVATKSKKAGKAAGKSSSPAKVKAPGRSGDDKKDSPRKDRRGVAAVSEGCPFTDSDSS